MSATSEPVPFEVYQAGVYLHGTKADLAVGEMLVPGRESNFEEGRVMNYVYFTATLDAAVWGAELAAGEGRGRIYIVDPSGGFEDDPNVTDKRFPGNPTQSFRSREPLRVVASLPAGSVTRRRKCRPCGTESLRQDGRAQCRSRTDLNATRRTDNRQVSRPASSKRTLMPPAVCAVIDSGRRLTPTPVPAPRRRLASAKTRPDHPLCMDPRLVRGIPCDDHTGQR